MGDKAELQADPSEIHPQACPRVCLMPQMFLSWDELLLLGVVFGEDHGSSRAGVSQSQALSLCGSQVDA